MKTGFASGAFEVVSDHIPLCGDARSVLAQPSEHNLFVNNPLLSIYLHAGGANAIYYDLVAKDEGKLSYIEVRVETAIPGKALVLAWRPLNALLDALVRNAELPWALSRLELVSPEDGELIACELILPYRSGVRIGPCAYQKLRLVLQRFLQSPCKMYMPCVRKLPASELRSGCCCNPPGMDESESSSHSFSGRTSRAS